MKKVLLKDIAARVGVAPSTVSFVMNGKEKEMRISEKLAGKIRVAAKQAGYTPNKVAVSLRTGASKILGLIVEDISNHFFATLAKTIEKEAEKFGYNVVFCSTENDDKKGNELLQILVQQQVDGFLITPTPGMCDQIVSLHTSDLPIVLMDRGFPDIGVPAVMVDNAQGVSSGLEHLLENGYQKIGFVTVNMDSNQMIARETAFVDMLHSRKLKPGRHNLLKLPVNTDREEMVTLIERFLRDNPLLDAVFFATNYIGIAGLESVRNLGLQVPGKLGIVCFDDHDIFRLYSPAITAIRQPTEEIAVRAVQMLLKKLNRTDLQEIEMSVQLPSTLNVRASSILV